MNLNPLKKYRNRIAALETELARLKPDNREIAGLLFRQRQQRLRLNQWRDNSELVGQAAAIIQDERFQRMLAVLETESPANFSFAGPTDFVQRAIQEAKTEGYNLAIDRLLSLGEFRAEQEVLRETYEPEKAPSSDE